ncbi:hypothetical protein FACS189454_00790 [Planctomycetales bacterium]|nr:hypothetical protein FACS189454_00790 [Planctomycetales bacterium]
MLTQVAVGQGPPWMQGPPPGGEQFGGGMGGMGRPPFGGGRDGQSFGGGRGGRNWQRPDGGTNPQNNGDRNQRRIEMLKGMDTNQNGTLEPSEIPEYRRQFVERIVAPFGISANTPINLKSIESRILAAPTQQPQGSDAASANQSSRNNTQPPVDPLVPPFGEKQETQSPVLSFGQKETKTPVGAAKSIVPLVSVDEQTLRSAKKMMTQYDKNKNGTLDKDKGEWSSALPFKPDSADKNQDGRISMSEMIAAMGGGGSAASMGASVVAVRQSNAYDKLPEGTPDWFFEADSDQDGQLTMQEYANGSAWKGRPMSNELVTEFQSIDRNGDGFATAVEIFTTLKETDEKKAREADQKKREDARRGIKTNQPPDVAENKDAPNSTAPPTTAPNNAAAPQIQQSNASPSAGSQPSGSSRSYGRVSGSSGQDYQRPSRRGR